MISQLMVLPAKKTYRTLCSAICPFLHLPLESQVCSSADRLFTQVVLRLKHQPNGPALKQIISKRGHPPRPDPLDRNSSGRSSTVGSTVPKGFTLKICEPVFETGHKEESFCFVDLSLFVVSFWAHAHESHVESPLLHQRDWRP